MKTMHKTVGLMDENLRQTMFIHATSALMKVLCIEAFDVDVQVAMTLLQCASDAMHDYINI